MNNTRRASGDLDPDKGITILVIILFSGRGYKDNNSGKKIVEKNVKFFPITGPRKRYANRCRKATMAVSWIATYQTMGGSRYLSSHSK